MILRRVGTVGSVGVAYHIPAAAHADWAPLSLLGGILSQQPNGRLYKALVESQKATSASAFAGNNHDPGLFTASAQAEPGQLDAVRDTLLQDARKPGDHAVHRRKRSRRPRSAAAATHEMMQSNSSAMAQALSSASALGDWRLLFVQRDRLQAVTADDVNRVARPISRSTTARSASTFPGRSRNGWPSRRRRRSRRIVKDYKGGTVAEAGEAFDPTPENLDARTKIVDARRHQGGPAAEEEPRRNGVAGADAALRQRGVAQGPDDGGRHAAGR